MLRSGESFAGYLIERELGRGGMGSVYLARHPRLPRLVAIKLLNQELFNDSEVRARFEREGDVVARLDHPNIVPLFDRGFDDDRLWIAMRYIDGVDAASLESANLPPRQAIRIVSETARALDFAHRKGVLHRDVKPANILLERVDGEERIFLADFGIARLRDENTKLTQTGSFTATLAYAAPEQLSGDPLTDRCDQYSLACTLFRLLTGTVPFDAQHPVAIMRGHLHEPPPPVSSLRPGLPPALDAVLARGMAKHPAARFDSCVDFATAAQRALDGVPMPGQHSGARHPMVGHPAPGQSAPGQSAPMRLGSGQPAFAPPSAGMPSGAVSGSPARPFAPGQRPVGVMQTGSAPAAWSGGGNVSQRTRPVPPPVQTKPGRKDKRGSGSQGAHPVQPAPTRKSKRGPTDWTGAPAAAPVRKPKRKSRARGCLLWLLAIIVVPLLVLGAILVAIDRAGSTGTSNSPAVTTPPEPAYPTSEEYLETSTVPEPVPSGGTVGATPEYPTTAAPGLPFGLR